MEYWFPTAKHFMAGGSWFVSWPNIIARDLQIQISNITFCDKTSNFGSSFGVFGGGTLMNIGTMYGST